MDVVKGHDRFLDVWVSGALPLTARIALRAMHKCALAEKTGCFAPVGRLASARTALSKFDSFSRKRKVGLGFSAERDMSHQLQERIEKLTAKLARAQALAMLKEQAEAKRAKDAARKADTRRKIELGGLVLIACRQTGTNPTAAALVGAIMEALANSDAARIARWERFGQAVMKKRRSDAGEPCSE
ncbi:TPA: conjugal transfer protein TraD [Burkholderia vietnamiensis]|uniref:conjugal transfer protein TraD n=1 Tax=Burkholderia vietnamiensis TaxID=60552 RepID=UPI002656BF5F|nr:conjugal transfer protein TraD [Burkholderia vietnamiensis]MDN8076153.1 conjugal transfer protein TraD [Burkholderia vietnamiensis]HDR8987265.1 conjugal transfer protein TraD [Burkholderia vietnamiensis]